MTDGQGGVDLIAAERRRQIEAEGWTLEHDDEHTMGELAGAATVYVIRAQHQAREAGGGRRYDARLDFPPTTFWPSEWDSWNPSDDPIRNLVKAGTLIAAEIDRLQRVALHADR